MHTRQMRVIRRIGTVRAVGTVPIVSEIDPPNRASDDRPYRPSMAGAIELQSRNR